MKKLFFNIIFSAVAISTIFGATACSKGSTMNGETMDLRTEQVRLNERNISKDMHKWDKDFGDFGDFLCPECGRKMNNGAKFEERCKDKNYKNGACDENKCQDKNYKDGACDENKCQGKNYKDGACDEDKCKDCEDEPCQDEDCKNCKEKDGKNVELPKPRQPKFTPGKGGKLPKKPHRLPPKSIAF